jgi:hypothetical protein
MVARAPRKRMYRSMQGRMIDIEKLRAANEDTRAIGNMNVNAKGDVLGIKGSIATPKAEVIKKYYEVPKGRVDDTPTRAKPIPPRKTPPAPQPKAVQPKSVPQPRVTRQAKPKTAPKPKKGIDAALDGIE